MVAQGPGAKEEEHGRPLYPKGWSGAKVHEGLSACGIEAYRLTNTTKCRGPRGKSGDMPPTVREVNNCRPYLEAEIAACRPKLIITFGASAFNWFFPKLKIDAYHGRPLEYSYVVDSVDQRGDHSDTSDTGGDSGVASRQTAIVYPMYHPAAVSPGRTGSTKADILLGSIIDDWNRLKRLYVDIQAGTFVIDNTVADTTPVSIGNQKYVVGRSVYRQVSGEKLAKMLSDAIQYEHVTRFAFDLETPPTGQPGNPTYGDFGFQARRATILGYSVCWKPHQAFFTWDSIEWIRPFLENPALVKVAHNAKFELLVCAAAGITVRNIQCTKLQAYVLRKPATHLKALSWSELGVKQTRYEEVNWSNPASSVPYGCADSDLTYQLDAVQMVQLTDGGLQRVYEFELAVLPVLVDMERTGVLIDPTPFKLLTAVLEHQKADVLERIHAVYPYDVLWTSPPQKAEVLYGPNRMRVKQTGDLKGRIRHTDDCDRTQRVRACPCHNNVPTGACSRIDYLPPGLALPVLRTTETGAPETGLPALRDLQEHDIDHPILELLIELASIEKCLSNDCTIPALIQEDGRVHGTFIQAGDWEERAGLSDDGTATARVASRNPNLQNRVHHGDDKRPYVARWASISRYGYIVPEGMVWVKCDASKEEPRIGAFLSDDSVLMHDLTKGDIYKVAASIAFNKPITEVNSEERQIGKRMAMAWLNRARTHGIQKSAFWLSDDEALAWCLGMDRHYWRFTQWCDETYVFLAEHGYVETWFGHRIYLPGIWSPDNRDITGVQRIAIPGRIQGTAAGVMKEILVRLDTAIREHGWPIKMLTTVHDEVNSEVPRNLVYQFVEDVLSNITDGIIPGLVLPVEIEVGDTWGTVKPWYKVKHLYV